MFAQDGAKGQAAIEYMTVIGLALLLSAPFVLKAQAAIIDLKMGSSSVAVQNALNDIETAVEMVNAAGNESTMTFVVNLPRNLNSTQVENNAVYITLDTPEGVAEYSRFFETNLTGSLPSDAGRHRIQVQSLGDEVRLEVVS